MDFTLRYRGALPATGDRKARVPEKNILRMHFHRQLANLWREDGRFGNVDPSMLQFPNRSGNVLDVRRPIPPEDGIAGWFYRFEVGRFFFVPLVNEVRGAQVHLAVRMHLRASDGGIFASGDLDNRLKLLFDALRMPHQASELESELRDGPGREHIFCLLDDDSRITRLTVESIPLLGDKEESENKHYAEIECDVTVKAIRPMMGNYAFLFP